ncbi:uncharacterized protein LOC107043837 [Diachasma alloeum]|uniref:uncharacterized protein LOC107043837 n=1 Tax=Diachasma alloeum TaxID=454923 RepID=UPI00073829AE|nr:uncharacterized protein LOC107043837 [Diachasma alloeum]
MGLFKIVPHDESRRIFVRAATTAELINTAKEKLKLVGEKYQLVLQEDGTEIDDDGILLEMASNASTTLALMILPEGISYASRLGETSTSVGTAASVSSSSTIISQADFENDRNLWSAFPSALLAAAKDDKLATDDQRRELVRNICHYVFDIHGDTSRGTAVAIAKTICSKYRATFVNAIDGVVIDSGWESLSAQIYSAINYRKARERSKRSAPPQGADPDDEDDDHNNQRPLPQPIPYKRDEYGCVEFQPLLEEGETPATQETKRKLLITLHEASPDIIGEEVKQLMNDTYATQRLVINECSRGNGLTVSFFKKWPFLKNAAVLLSHAQRLLGTQVEEVWSRNLLQTAPKIRKFCKYEYLTQVMTAQKRGKELPDKFVKNTIKEAKRQAREVTRSELSLTLVMFPLLVQYFEEVQDFLYVIVESTLMIEEIVANINNTATTMIIRGTSLYDERASCSILLDKQFGVKVANILEGFLLTFLCYFIFGCKYPKELQCTLEFVQRVIMLINPLEGSKRKSKKRKQTSYEPKVLKLIKMLKEINTVDP